MNMILHNPEIIADQPTPQLVPQFQQVSSTALRQRISELNAVQEELKDRLRRQEQATRNAIGVGVLSTVLAATAIVVTFWTRANDFRSGTPLVAVQQATPAYPVAAPTYPVLASMR
jgi:hypothetical protein